MGPFIFLSLFSGVSSLMLNMWDGDDDEELQNTPDIPDAPDVQEIPEVMLDTGASFSQSEKGVEIDLGDDETGTLAVIYYVDTEDNVDDFVQTDEARFYLVPEGTDWSDASYETRSDIPGAQDYGGMPHGYELADFEDHFGLELLGVMDLKDIPSDTDNPSDRVGEITSNEPIDGFYLGANTDGDDLIYFLPEDYVVTKQGVPELTVFDDTIGTDGTDWLSADADGITVDGAGGDDFLETSHANVTLNGGLGDDTIDSRGTGIIDTANTDMVFVNGGEGDDEISTITAVIEGGLGDDNITLSNGIAHGGEGDDKLNIYGNDEVGLVYGDTGNDRLVASGAGSEAYGGVGDDFVGLSDFATGYGGDGDDHLQAKAGTTADGGAGNDLITVWDFFDNEDGPAVVTSGEGADTIDVLVRNPGGGDADNHFLHVTDFDPIEDILQIGAWNGNDSVDGVEIVEAGNGSHTDLRVTFSNTSGAYGGLDGTTIIRLEGISGITTDHFVITD